ncbi:creatininase [Bradyrhizobium sp. SSBR45G]|uniref:creatininase family protein n=1 Tax=unclassified Bradyrhizobium TaxID=2631580 RepID=UPI0023429199|nr:MULTISPECIES: creatininase family protein [unclassified Bradyrhizobium]GLH80773.1 creatininase [Bradyrhizobium sp. SSBR45G]GLH88189.1 creatininase [Bradyrhizobium sp. SSBR45R]
MTLPPRDWTELHWPAFETLVSGTPGTARWIAVLPLAATEQHGPHLPLGTDVYIAEAYLARVRALLPQALPVTFLPVQPVGISTEHIDYPGTLTVPTSVALKSWRAIGDSVARAGIRKLVIVTSHGGNSAAMTLVAQDLRADHRMLVVTTSWSRFGAPDGLFSSDELRHGIHGGAVETSIMQARHPELVRSDAIANFASSGAAMESSNRVLSTQRPAPLAWQTQDLNLSGAVGDATQASAEKGERVLEHGARGFCALLQDVDNFDVNTLRDGPLARR